MGWTAWQAAVLSCLRPALQTCSATLCTAFRCIAACPQRHQHLLQAASRASSVQHVLSVRPGHTIWQPCVLSRRLMQAVAAAGLRQRGLQAALWAAWLRHWAWCPTQAGRAARPADPASQMSPRTAVMLLWGWTRFAA